MRRVGSLLIVRIPLSSPSAASTIISLIFAFEVGVFETNLKSIEDTLGVGTLTAVPSSFPFNAGKTSPTALAAPVEAGIKIRQLLGLVANLCEAYRQVFGRLCKNGSLS